MTLSQHKLLSLSSWLLPHPITLRWCPVVSCRVNLTASCVDRGKIHLLPPTIIQEPGLSTSPSILQAIVVVESFEELTGSRSNQPFAPPVSYIFHNSHPVTMYPGTHSVDVRSFLYHAGSGAASNRLIKPAVMALHEDCVVKCKTSQIEFKL